VGVLKEFFVVAYSSLHVVLLRLPQTCGAMLEPYAKMNMAFGW